MKHGSIHSLIPGVALAIALVGGTTRAATPATAPSADAPAATTRPALLGVRKIWDAAPHNAFTDLVRFNGHLVCAFRESSGHIKKDGYIRVILSDDDGETWSNAADLRGPRGDVRDAKLAPTPDGRLALLTCVNLSAGGYQSVVYGSADGKTWEGPRDVAEHNVWLWGLKFNEGVGYSVGYGTLGSDRYVRLYRTTDATRTFAAVTDKLAIGMPFPNESALAFAPDGTATLLQRCDPDPAVIGTAKPPYTNWTFKASATRVGGPALLRLADGRWLGAGRLFDDGARGKGPRTSLFWVEPTTGAIDECLRLPSGGDTSYPGFAWTDDGALLVSYYSSHEGKTSIYLARVAMPPRTGPARKAASK